MGRDEHKKSRGKRHLAQTPKQQVSDGVDFEFSNEFLTNEDTNLNERKKNNNKRSDK